MWKGSQQMAKVHTTTIIILTTWQEGETGETMSTSPLSYSYFLSSPAPTLRTVQYGVGTIYKKRIITPFVGTEGPKDLVLGGS